MNEKELLVIDTKKIIEKLNSNLIKLHGYNVFGKGNLETCILGRGGEVLLGSDTNLLQLDLRLIEEL